MCFGNGQLLPLEDLYTFLIFGCLLLGEQDHEYILMVLYYFIFLCLGTKQIDAWLLLVYKIYPTFNNIIPVSLNTQTVFFYLVIF
jgi:hypothetical protein